MVCEEVLLHVVDLIPLDAVRLIGTVDGQHRCLFLRLLLAPTTAPTTGSIPR